MLSSIHPLGERARGNRWGATAGWYLAGSMLGGAAIGTVAGLLGWGLAVVVEPSPVAIATATIAILVTSAALDGFGVRLPSPDRQVDEDWMARYRPWVYGGGYGFQLGTGVMTFVKTASVYAVWLLVAVAGSPVIGLAVGAWFGLVRGAALLSVARVADPIALRAYFRRMASLAGTARAVAVVGPVVVAATLAAFQVAA